MNGSVTISFKRSLNPSLIESFKPAAFVTHCSKSNLFRKINFTCPDTGIVFRHQCGKGNLGKTLVNRCPNITRTPTCALFDLASGSAVSHVPLGSSWRAAGTSSSSNGVESTTKSNARGCVLLKASDTETHCSCPIGRQSAPIGEDVLCLNMCYIFLITTEIQI